MAKYNVIAVTGTRAEYGILKELLKELKTDREVDLSIVATGMHLEEKYGYTFQNIIDDGLEITYKIPMNLINTNNSTLLNGMSILQNELGQIFENKKFDLCVILGDRYEMLSVVNACTLNRIPICHLHGGEKTLGNYDDVIRHAITKMSHIHLTSTEEYSQRVKQLGEQNVYNIGSLGVNNVMKEKFLTKEELEQKFKLTLKKPYFVVLFHPVTLKGKENVILQTKELLKALKEFESSYDFIFIGSNSDTWSDEITKEQKKFLSKQENSHMFKSLPTQDYHSFIKSSKGLIGNSSSGIIEVPSLNVYTLNIGDRQEGRVRGNSIIDVKPTYDEIKKGLEKIVNQTKEAKEIINPYYKSDSLKTGLSIIKYHLEKKINIKKEFIDLEFN